MAEFYRGKRVSDYRKEIYSQTGSNLSVTPLWTIPFDGNLGIRYIKNIRGYVTISGNDSTPYNNHIAGFMAMVRYPKAEAFDAADMKISASYVLHPVPFCQQGYQTVWPYTFKGITLGEDENLLFVVDTTHINGTFAGSLSLLFNRRYVPVIQ